MVTYYIFCYSILEIGSSFSVAMTHFKSVLSLKKIILTVVTLLGFALVIQSIVFVTNGQTILWK